MADQKDEPKTKGVAGKYEPPKLTDYGTGEEIVERAFRERGQPRGDLFNNQMDCYPGNH